MEYFYITFSKIAHLIFVLIMNLSVKHMSLATKWYPSISFTHINCRHIHHFSLWQLRPTISQKNMNAVTSLSEDFWIKSYTPLIKFSGWYNDTYRNTQTSLICCIKSPSYLTRIIHNMFET